MSGGVTAVYGVYGVWRIRRRYLLFAIGGYFMLVRKYVGILIVAVGGLLGLTSLIAVSFDGARLLGVLNAPLFEQALSRLLVANQSIFKIASFAFTIMIMIFSMVGFSRRSTNVGSLIMFLAILAGFSGWPSLTPFMLIVILGAHWLVIAEHYSHHAQVPQKDSHEVGKRRDDGKKIANESKDPLVKKGQRSDADEELAPTHDSGVDAAGAPSDNQAHDDVNQSTVTRGGGIKRIIRSFFK